MDDNSLLLIVLAFILGCMCSGMIRQMCGGRFIEGAKPAGGDSECKLCLDDSSSAPKCSTCILTLIHI